MPGAPFLYVSDTYQGTPAQGVAGAAAPSAAAPLTFSFWLWLIVIGVLIPVVVLGGLRAGGFQFVYRRR